ncbi:MAG: 2,3-bisphosphoglycerate-independent phosphoglycerate mutase [bacterium]|nr:2,3-bisphosphoglycerate-independent phosphoglycerate mutase [bacterium]
MTQAPNQTSKKLKDNKVLLIILDGWGLAPAYEGNAIELANTPFWQKLWATSKTKAILSASGEAVGLPDGQMGTSEVNHLTIGSGRVLFQDLVKINKAIANESFFNNPAFIQAFEHVKKNNSTLHIQGLISPGGVHSHEDHVFSLLKAAKLYGIKRVFVHVFTDGRDTLPQSAKQYIQELQDYMQEIGVGQIASISGRYYAMDRDHNWDRTDRTFEVLEGKKDGHKVYKTALEAIEDAYEHGINDEFIEPALIEVNDSGEVGAISTHDAVIFANFRNDRTRQLTERILGVKEKDDLEFVTMTQYKPEYQVLVAYAQEDLKNTLGEVLSKNKKKQLRVTETEKFAHLTFFFNAKREEAFESEDRFMIDSYSDIKTHDQKPQMRTPDIAERLEQELAFEKYDFISTNLCNADMVGHTSNIPATIKGIETIDQALSKVIPLATKHGYTVIITADHGNAEEMLDRQTGAALTAHTINPVPFVLVPAGNLKVDKLTHEEGLLADVAPTILKIMALPKPKEMTGKSFI